ncbi:iron-siderophore ABC transporter substrate-binding protein [Paenibacillus sp. SYP-B3998]|uniref:Iron-siderophore ABC transporter substrate-binding protein n=1 Tax=Paenibacillus sp. SYP-B3998 TaxID=2678564 RepID=A0A6G3ZSB7_9BACL|nr:iron-siderophore ABC transporter substrate-binding protein [Paenibacillus sp. SYP-B3998]NEW05106.1 iron-siderophore ABC transporter substrate-binding protein [Paenibacillus sp. SYP-B3998]
MYLKKKVVLIVMGVLILTTLFGCSSNKEAKSNEGIKTSSSQARVIKDLKGEQRLTDIPKKIAVLAPNFGDYLVALGVKPNSSVAIENDRFIKYLTEGFQGVKPLGTMSAPNLEATLEASPDLIIAFESQDKVYDQLQKIAPTLLLERFADWRTNIVTFGQITGKEIEAKKVIADYDKKTSEWKTKLSQKLGEQTVGVLRVRDKELRLYMKSGMVGTRLYKELGLNTPSLVVDSKDEWLPMSMEMLPKINPDHIFLMVDDEDKMKELKELPLWTNLNAVRSGHVYPIDTELWITGNGPIGINLVVDQVAENLMR